MAENIQVKFTVDKTQLDGAIASSKTLEAELKKAGVSAQNMDAALEGVNDALNEAGVDAKTFAKALDQSAQSTKSLRTQLAEAKNEAVRMSQQFGAFSKEAQNAAKKAALIKDEIGDLNDTLDALNPDAKLNAFVKLGQGIQGGFQAATGALQLFGVENERITKLAQQFQGVLNLTQGINSVLQLKDVYGQLRLVLGVTATAQNTLTTATVAQGTATTGATVATRGFTAALAANPFTAVAVALTVLIGAVVAYAEATDDAAESTERIKKAYDDLIDKSGGEINDRYKIVIRELKQQKALLEAQKADTIQILSLDKEIADTRVKGITELIGFYGRTKELSDSLDEALSDQAIALAKLQQAISEIPKRVVESFTSAEVKDGLENAVKELREQIQAELDKLEPIPTKNIKTGTEDLIKEINLQVKEVNSQILQSSLQTFDNLLDAQAQGRIQQLEEEKKAGIITEEKYAKEVSKIKRRQALQDRAFAVFNVALSTAEAVMKVSAQLGALAAPLIAAYIALGAAQTAAILSAPLPKFKTGTLNVGGGNVDSDGGMHAIVHKGEAIIPADRNRDYHPTISALFKRQIKPSDINSFVEMKLKGRVGNQIDARISSKDLRNLKPMESVSIRNSSTLARQIGREIAFNINLRRQ